MNQTTTQALKVKNIGTRTPRLLKKLAHAATAQACDVLIPVAVAQSMTNCTAIYRTVEACDFIATGDVKSLDPVTAYVVAAVMLSTDSTITYSKLHFLCGLNREGGQHINGVSRARLSRFLTPKGKRGASMSAGTITSKVSRSVGTGGLLRALGIVKGHDVHSVTLTESARTSPFMLAYATALQSVTDGALALVSDADE